LTAFNNEGNKLKKPVINRKAFTDIGYLDKCPHCLKKLNTIPVRKKKCPFCGEYIFVKTRPLDEKKVLVTEEQKKEIDKQWRVYHICPVCGSGMPQQQSECYICQKDKVWRDDRNAKLEYYKRSGVVKAVKWNLSSWGKLCDICKALANEDSYGLGPGVFPLDKVPDLPHHGCDCYLTPVLEDEIII